MSGSTRSYEMAKRLVKNGHKVDIVTSWRAAESWIGAETLNWHTSEIDGIAVHWYRQPYSNDMGTFRRLISFSRFALAAAVRAVRLESDVVIASSTPLTIALPAIYCSWRKKIPMVFEVRDLWPEIPIALGVLKSPISIYLARTLEKIAYSSAEKIIALSPDMARGVRRLCGEQKDVTVIPNCADLHFQVTDKNCRSSYRQAINVSDDDCLMVYAGTFGRVNGVTYLIHLADRLRNIEKFQMLLIGSGKELDSIKHTATRLGLSPSRVKILEATPKSQMPIVLNAADIVVSTVIDVPELNANSANKIFDGMAAGRCVAINHGGWLKDLISETDIGILLDHDLDSSAQVLEEWVSNPARIRDAGLRARKVAEQKFSRDELAKMFESTLLNAIDARRQIPGEGKGQDA